MLGGRRLDQRSARWAAGALTLALPLVVGGCSEPASFDLSWRLVDALTEPAMAPPLTSVEQCAQVGVSKIRVTTFLGDVCTGVIVAEQEFPCFSDALGPPLEVGDYTLLVEGLRRTGEPWSCHYDECNPDPLGPPPSTCVARTTAELSVSESGTLPELDVVLLSPPECDDGIDNDRDGRVDDRDPACILNAAGSESADASVTLFQTSVSFLDSPAIEPFNVGVDALLLEVSDEQLTVVADYQLDLTQWPYRLPLLSRALDPGSYEFSITAVGAGLVPLTQPFTQAFVVEEDEAAFVLGNFAFTDDRFLEPIIQPIAFTTNLLLSPGATTGPSCDLGGYVGVPPNQEIRSLDRLWVRVTDGSQALDAATLGLTGFAATGPIMPVDEPGGWVSFDCPTAGVKSAAITWGGYDIEVQGRIGADTCFATPQISDLAPQPTSAQDFYLDRVLVDGLPPAACIECVDDSGCTGQVCVDNVCVYK